MFGYVIANSEIMSEEDKKRYKSVYCGLCKTLKERHGQTGRMTLNYDMTFLILVLNSLYEPAEHCGEERCMIHPATRHDYLKTEITEYASDMNVALSYLNLLDNWHDEKNIFSLIYALKLKKKYRQIEKRYPRQCAAMESCIKRLSALEAAREYDPDASSRLFGELMGEIFVLYDDRWSNTLRAMASSLGEFIYLMDAVIDLNKDMRKHRYNPFIKLKTDGRNDDYFKDILTMLIGNCTMEFEKLPLVEDVSIMKNILCSGVWIRYDLENAKKERRKGDKRL